MQIRKLANTFATFVISSLSLTLMSFTDGRMSSGDPKKQDSVSISKNSKSLFSSHLLPNLAISIPLNPMVVPFVTDYLKKQNSNFNKMKVWGKSYFDLFDKILTEYNVPCQLKYLSVIESNLKPAVVSSAGAVGPWQIMPTEAQSYGLRTGKIDDRKDFAKSTRVAAKLLSNLYKSFGDWLLVIAAYNAGAGRVRQAIKKAGSSNFWAIQSYLPAETRNHVKRFIATHFYFEGSGGITTMTAEELTTNHFSSVSQSEFNTKSERLETVEIQGRYNSTIMAKYLQIDVALLNNLNPGLKEALNKGIPYQLKLPSNKVNLFNQYKSQILKESVQTLISAAVTISSVK